MTDPEQILSRYEGTLAEAQRKSDAIREGLSNLRVTERSADGQITVTVNDAGNLVDLRLGNALQRKDGTAVGQDVLRVVQAAQARVATAVQEAMSPMLGGEDSEAMHFMMDKLRSAQPPPPPEFAPGGWGADQPRFDTIEDDAPPPPSRPSSPPPVPRHDDDDQGDGGFLR
jgi:DNA-binding protein YbaB